MGLYKISSSIIIDIIVQQFDHFEQKLLRSTFLNGTICSSWTANNNNWKYFLKTY